MSVCLSYLWLFWRRKSVLLGEKIIVCTDNHFRFQCCQILVKLATFGPSVATKFLYLMMFISTVRQETYIENHSEKFTSTKAHLRLKCLQENSYFLTTHLFCASNPNMNLLWLLFSSVIQANKHQSAWQKTTCSVQVSISHKIAVLLEAFISLVCFTISTNFDKFIQFYNANVFIKASERHL